jgi:insertion element IS1 protein InsB
MQSGLAGKAVVLEVDEMWHYIKKTAQTLALESVGCWYRSTLLDWECGRRDKATLTKMIDHLAPWDMIIYHTDRWGTYAAVLQDKLVMSKTGRGRIERNHCRERHWFGRFKRKSITVSKSQEMLDLTMAFFAKFWVNGHQGELLSLLC